MEAVSCSLAETAPSHGRPCATQLMRSTRRALLTPFPKRWTRADWMKRPWHAVGLAGGDDDGGDGLGRGACHWDNALSCVRPDRAADMLGSTYAIMYVYYGEPCCPIGGRLLITLRAALLWGTPIGGRSGRAEQAVLTHYSGRWIEHAFPSLGPEPQAPLGLKSGRRRG